MTKSCYLIQNNFLRDEDWFANCLANFNSTVGVAIDAAGNVWVANLEGNSVTELTSSGGLGGNFNNTTRVAPLSARRLIDTRRRPK
jgi:hypothetical protein